MSEITRVGGDLAKNLIQVHAVDAAGKVVTNRQLQRNKFIEWCVQLPAGCLVAMEASAGSHQWARKLVGLGLDARIMSAHLVSPYRIQGKSGKNDANDAAAICEAASRPNMRFVTIKTASQQGILCVHRLREGLKEERTACINRIRGLLAEFGLVVAQSTRILEERLSELLEDASNDLPGLARLTLERAQMQWREIDQHLQWCDQRIAAHIKEDRQAQAAMQIMGIGPVTASAVVATVGDFKQFKSGAQFGAWLGLTPRQSSSGGKNKLGAITKKGDQYLRTLLVQGAKSVVFRGVANNPITRWAQELRDRSGWQKAAVALANKNARTLWALLTKGVEFNAHHISVKPTGLASSSVCVG